MTTQQETMRHYLNLLESVSTKTGEMNDKELQKIAQAFGGLNEEQLNEVNWKKLAASSALIIATLAPSLSHALTTDEVKVGTAISACGAVLDVSAQGIANLPPDVRSNIKSLGDQLWKAHTEMINKAKSQGDAAGASVISNSYGTTKANAENLIKTGQMDKLASATASCVKFAK